MECPALFVLLMTQVEVVRIPILCGVSAVFPISACLTIPQQHHTHCSLSNISYMLHRTDMNISDRWKVTGARWQVTGDRFLLQELHSVPALTGDLEHVLTEGGGESELRLTVSPPQLVLTSPDMSVLTSRWPPGDLLSSHLSQPSSATPRQPHTGLLPPAGWWVTASVASVASSLQTDSQPRP